MCVVYLYSPIRKSNRLNSEQMQVILYKILAWVLYNVIFKFIIPVYRASRTIRKGFREMQSRMNEQMRQQQPGYADSAPTSNGKSTTKSKSSDYIDFEEVK